MKYILTIALIICAFVFNVPVAQAAPWTSADNAVMPNDKFVAYYQDGRHAIAGIGDQFFGRDLVMARGNNGQFHQWFEGFDEYGIFVAIHSVWNISKTGHCPDAWVTVENAYPQWGDYLQPGATYCVHNNYYLGTK